MLHFRVIFFDAVTSAPTTPKNPLQSLTDYDEDDYDYYYYYDLNSDDNLDVEDFPDYEDYQDINTRSLITKGNCIKVLKNEAQADELLRRIGPLWRSLAQHIGIIRCSKGQNKQTKESNDAVRFGD